MIEAGIVFGCFILMGVFAWLCQLGIPSSHDTPTRRVPPEKDPYLVLAEAEIEEFLA